MKLTSLVAVLLAIGIIGCTTIKEHTKGAQDALSAKVEAAKAEAKKRANKVVKSAEGH